MLRILTDHPLKGHNSFGLDVRAKKFVQYDSAQELQAYLRDAKATEALLHIGTGSNLLFTKDYDGTILHSAIKSFEILREESEVVFLRIGAGLLWDDVVLQTLQMKFYGLENLSHIPSETGAAAVQNIGAYGAEIKDFVHAVETIDLNDGSKRTFTNAECQYAYRYSIFKGPLKGRYAVTHVQLRLHRNFQPNLTYRALRDVVSPQTDALSLRQQIIAIRQSKLPDPKEQGNAGSFFMNPVVSQAKYQELIEKYPQMPHFPVADGIKIPAGWLIEQAGWKGRCVGRAGVYQKQALVLVNLGGARPEEIIHLSQSIVADVEQKFGIRIHPEVNWI